MKKEEISKETFLKKKSKTCVGCKDESSGCNLNIEEIILLKRRVRKRRLNKR